MTDEERELNRHDCILPPPCGNPPTQNKTTAELKLELDPLNISNNQRLYRLAELQEFGRNNNIDLKFEKTRE
jgi:hypothetical protein